MAETTYERIIRVGTHLMGKNGFHGTSLQMIADGAGVSKSTIVHYFASKEGVLVAILDLHMPRISNNLIPLVSATNMSGTEKLRKFIDYHIDQLEKKWETVNLFVSQSQYLDKYNRNRFATMHSNYWNHVAEIIAQIQDEKQGFANLDPKIVAIGIIGMLSWIGLWFRKNGKYDIRYVGETMYRIIAGQMGNAEEPIENNNQNILFNIPNI